MSQLQGRFEREDLLRHARLLDLDLERLAMELQNHTYAPRIREDFMSGIRSGANGTPTFFVNGVRHNGSYEPETLLEALDGSL